MTNFFNLDGQPIYVPITGVIGNSLYEKLLDVVISVQNEALDGNAKKVVLFINFRNEFPNNFNTDIYNAIINLLSTIPRNQIYTVITGNSTDVLELFFLAPKGQRYIFNNTHSEGKLQYNLQTAFTDDEFKEFINMNWLIKFSSSDPFIEKHGIRVVDRSNIQAMFKIFNKN